MFIGMLTCIRRQPHRAGSTVTPASGATVTTSRVMHVVGLLGFLALVSFYLAKRPSDEKTENAALRDRIASLTANCPVECG
jgi:hypothetical protein